MEDNNFIRFDKEKMFLNIGDIIEVDFYTTTITAINFGTICVYDGFASTTVEIEKIKSVYPIQDQRFNSMVGKLKMLGFSHQEARHFIIDMSDFTRCR